MNTIEYGQGAVNNTIGWGQGAKVGSSFSNTKSILLDGVDDFCETSSNYTLLDGESKATISAWVNLQTGTTQDYLCAIKEIGATNFTLGVRLQISGAACSVNVRTQNASNVNRGIVSVGSIVGDGLWHHLLICVDLALTGNTELQVFLDGVSKGIVGRFQNTTFTSVSAPLYVGHADTYNFVDGNIDEFAIWSGTDQRANVSEIYGGGVAVDLNALATAPNPTTWYRMGDGDTAPTIQDTNGSADLTMNNFSTFSTDVPT
jgi:hypothetical protein